MLFEENAFVFVNIYAPNDVAQQITFFNKLSKQLEEFTHDTIIITGGDFNCVLILQDKKWGNLITKQSPVIKEINALSNLYNLNDIWRKMNQKNTVSLGELNPLKFNVG